MLPAHQIHTYIQPDTLPPEAGELFGDAWQQDWADTTPTGPVRVAIGVTTDGLWLAGLAMSLESVEQPAGKPVRMASIMHLIITPGARGQGLAGRLIRRATTVAQENGCTHLRSTAGFGCPDHLRLYHRLKFEQAGPTHRPYLVIRAL